MDKVDVLKYLEQDLKGKGIAEFETLETTIVSVFKNCFGEKDDFTKKAEEIKSGWGVDSAISHMYGQISDHQYARDKYETYLSLFQESIAFLEKYNIKKNENKKQNEKATEFHISNFNVTGSVVTFGDVVNSNQSIDNSINEIEKQIEEKGGEDKAELYDVLNEIKEIIVCIGEAKIPKKQGLGARLNAHLVKHGWFYGAILQLLGTAALSQIG